MNRAEGRSRRQRQSRGLVDTPWRVPARITNDCLAMLLAGAGYASLEQFATDVNTHAAHTRGLQLHYDRARVVRWLQGGACEHPDVVAEVLSTGWGIQVPPAVIWPGTRGGGAPIPAHQQPWVARHTLEQLAILTRGDLLTATAADHLATEPLCDGSVLVTVVRAWLSAPPGPFNPTADGGTPVTTAMVEHVEHATAGFAAQAAAIGGGLCRAAAVGQLRDTVDLLRHGQCDPDLGNRLLVAIADLAGAVAAMCHDTAVPLAHTYAVYGLQTAHASTDPRSRLVGVALLVNLVDQLHAGGQPGDAIHLLDLATGLLTGGSWQHPTIHARLHSRRAALLATLAPDRLDIIRGIITLSHTVPERDGADWPQNVLTLTGGADLHHTRGPDLSHPRVISRRPHPGHAACPRR